MSSLQERYERLQAILRSSAYQLAYKDTELLSDPELRPTRVQLELMKPELTLREQGIQSTVVVFGSARVDDKETAEAQLNVLEKMRASHDSPALQRKIKKAKRRVEQSRYYEEARRFAYEISSRFQQANRCDFVVITGGGPGIMEAANRGAFEAGARSIGLNITLPNEQMPNSYISPELAFQFHYFATRKMHFLLHAHALVVFPGGYGTLDELFEVLTLIQTEKMAPIPIVLLGKSFWERLIDFDFLVEEGYIDAEDAELFTYVEKADEVVTEIERFYAENNGKTIAPRKSPLQGPGPC